MRNCDKLARRALALIEHGGYAWCQHAQARDAGGCTCDVDAAEARAFDLEGALRRAASDLQGVTREGRDAALAQALDAVVDELVRRHAAGLDRYGGNNDRAHVNVSAWNDVPGRKASEVREVLRGAIEALARKVAA